MTTPGERIRGEPVGALSIGPATARIVAVAAGAYALTVGVITLLGYGLDVRRLTDWYDHGISMFPNTAVCATLSGAALLLLGAAVGRTSRRIAFRVAAGMIGLVGGLTLVQHLAGVNFGIDTLLFQRTWGQRAAAAPMRMGPPASSAYLIAGLALLLVTYGMRARRVASALGILIVAIGSLSLVGFWFGADRLFGVARFTGIAFQTSTVLVAIGIGLIASVPESGLAAILRRDDPGGVIVRRLLLPIIAIPLTLAWLRVLGHQAGYFDVAFGVALFVLVMIALLATLLCWTANGISRQAGLARAADQAVRESERVQRVLAEVGELGARMSGADELIGAMCASVGREFGVSRCGLALADLEAGTLTVVGDYSDDRRSLAGVYPISKWATQEVFSGRVVASEDLSTAALTAAEQPWGTVDLRACLSAPLYRKGKLAAIFWVGHHEPRRWSAAEVEWIRLIADRVWTMVERNRAEQCLRENESRLRTIIEQLPAGVGVMDKNGAWVLTNSTMAMYVPKAIPSAVPDRVSRWRFWNDAGDLVPPENWPGQRALRGEEVLPGMEALYRHDDGREIWMRISAAPLRNDSGDVTGAACVVQDIDLPKRFRMKLQEELDQRTAEMMERTQAEQSLRENEARLRITAEALQESDRRKTEFLGILAHELRNPLTPISNAVELMRTHDGLPPDLARLREVMDGQVRQLVRLIDDLMDVSRITRGKLELRKRRVTLLEIIDRALEACRPTAQEHSHKLVVKQTAGSAALDADPERLIQVVCNLLNNAIRYTPEGGTITLTTALDNGYAVVRVTDTGIGIPPDKRAEIFEMFAQAHPGNMAAGGLGIGLSLAKMLVERHGGTIAVDSAGAGRGSQFTVRLPVLEAVPEAQTPAPAAPTSHRRLRVLVVDDHKVVGDTFAMLLESTGQEVQVARSARQALEMAPQYRPHVIFSDISMPEMDGYELARRFRADDRLAGTRLIAVTGYGQAEDIQAARTAGFHDHMVKPPTTEQLQRLFDRIDTGEDVAGQSDRGSGVVVEPAVRP